MSTPTMSVGEAFPLEQARVRAIQQQGREIGPAGAFLVWACEEALRQAERAAISGDPVAILQAYQELKGFQE